MAKLILTIAILLLCFAVATIVRSAQRRIAIEAEYPAEGQFLNVDGHTVHSLQMGSGPDVVLIHGASGSTRDFTFSLASKLAEEFRVTMFDRPGLGYTPALAPQCVTLNAQTDLLVRASLQMGIDTPIVVGHSFGGALVMSWAVNHPDRIAAAVSISGATYPWPGKLDGFYKLLSRPVLGPIIANILSAWVPRSYVRGEVEGVFLPQHAPVGYADHIGAELNLRPESLVANAQQRTDLRAQLRSLSKSYATIAIPIEILHGTADKTVDPEIHSAALERDAQSAHLTRLNGVGHMPHHVDEPAVIDAIRRAATRAGLR
ncbi:alpha/beta hydrolase [Pseudooceanicola sediminis]|uniref:Alpha/beta hydrolase n=1 Tax=Pseudooceanicola sediminis TaxID=2211117 RepID=A0A399J5I3_9RHOB|nr:alpha/beta hydrolase [Pseudooceanicola sediminis]KAA2316890.1 alpha/beta hydrolase [Puniceibacterium sp. HSS470]RII40655.1 alpha/beta hydrolase [Pseudooceanicola sediminis]